MEIGLFFGSFNPIHTGHLLIANHILNFTSLNKICFVVSPQNPLKGSNNLLDAEDRLKLVQISISGDERFEVSDVEFNLPKPLYTINTLERLKSTYPQHQYHLIIGSDNFLNFDSWKSPDKLRREWKIIVYVRPGFPIDTQPNSSNIQILNPALIDISSTSIRGLIKKGKSIRYLVPEPAFKEIVLNKYYQ